MFDLQQVETRLEAARAQLHSVDQQLKSSPELERVRSEVERVSKETDGVRASLRRLESQAEDAEDKVKRLTAVLYGGSIHDSREMASMEAEIDHARSRQSELEDQEISLMEQLEGLEARLLAARSRVEELTAGREQSLAPLTKQRGDLEQSVEALARAREEAAAQLSPSALTTYNRLKERTGHAVSVVEGGICQWCRVQIPPKDVQHARGDTIVTCNNCGRVLYAE